MKINGIILQNFGSYEGINQFDTSTSMDKNIILIGGKNGAGKTTLFTAIRLCLYGCLSMGHKAINSAYYRNISKLFNNAAKLNKPTVMSVVLNLDLENEQGVDRYLLKRTWVLNDTVFEKFEVEKNNKLLENQEKNDFEKYIFSIVPPELFNLYFFDGEKIADYFLTEGSNERIKKAFLTLCGYDIFDIMQKNFKRIYTKEDSDDKTFNSYLRLKDEYLNEKNNLNRLIEESDNCQLELDNLDSEILSLEEEFSRKGGITQSKWNELKELIKQEEKTREDLNLKIKNMANDTIPFLMIKDELINLKKQINDEINDVKFQNFYEILHDESISKLLDAKKTNEILETASNKYLSKKETILKLSASQSAQQLYFIDRIVGLDNGELFKIKCEISKSIKNSEKFRKQLEDSDLNSEKSYAKQKSILIEKKNNILEKKLHLENVVNFAQQNVERLKKDVDKSRIIMESELKKKSINNISSKSIMMLDKLQNILFSKEVKRVENNFRYMIKTLTRKQKFIDDIMIDDNFIIHVYRKETLSYNQVKQLMNDNTREQLVSIIGEKAVESIEFIKEGQNVNLNIEIDKTSLSQGEKQIFVMALYYSLIKLSKHTMPFIIDTPFARIDTEHRYNISTHFFNKLDGQLFILSTNEEINDEHVNILKDKVKRSYLLLNDENKKTLVLKGKYFEVDKHGV